MNLPRHLLLLLLFTVFVPVRPAVAQSAELDELRQRSATRAPVILRLKTTGQVREGANGLLESTTQLAEQDNGIVQAENRDRSSAFSLIALRHNLPVPEVQGMFASAARSSNVPAGTPAPGTNSSPGQNPPGTSAVTPPAPAGTPSSPPAAAATPQTNSTPPAPAAQLGLLGKVLNRPAANLYESPDDTARRLRENLPGFSVFYVVTSTADWVQISATEGGAPLGWLRANDTIPWRHNLAVRFAHEGRGNRQPVAFFDSMPRLETALAADAAKRTALVESAAGRPNRDAATAAGIVAVQPELVDRNQFYVLPILEHREVGPGSFTALRGESRLLRVAAMRQTGNPGASTPGTAAASADTARPSIDLVFVMDLSSSMKPFVDATTKAIAGVSEKLTSGTLAPSVKFGFWGYRDRAPDQDFGAGKVTKNFTPALQGRQEFLQTLAGVDVSSSPAGDYAEAVFYGVRDAIESTAWTPGAMRVIILIGDASSHAAGNEKNPQNLSQETVRALANAGSSPTYILPIYILRDSPLAAADEQVARVQFRELGRNPNLAAEGLYLQIAQTASTDAFEGEIRGALDQFVTRLDGAADFEASRRAPPVSTPRDTATAGAATTLPNAAAMADSIFSGAYLDWLAALPAGGASVEDSLAGWALDKDLAAPEIQALDVVFLINKSQLDTLVRMLNQIIDAGVRSKVRGTGFFASLQSVVGRAAVDPNALGAATALGETQLAPDFLRGLPYKSELLSLTADEWRGMSAADQSAFLDRLNSNVNFYTDLARDPAKWHALNPGDNRESHVTAIPLERLP